MILYSGFKADIFISNICYFAMKCAYKNNFIYFTFATSLLSDKNYIISRNTFESFFEISSNNNDSYYISSKLMLLAIYINQTYEIDRALELIESEIKNNVSKFFLILLYLAKAICLIYNSKCRSYFYKRHELLNSALESLNYVFLFVNFNLI